MFGLYHLRRCIRQYFCALSRLHLSPSPSCFSKHWKALAAATTFAHDVPHARVVVLLVVVLLVVVFLVVVLLVVVLLVVVCVCSTLSVVVVVFVQGVVVVVFVKGGVVVVVVKGVVWLRS